jgi:hypothetical protein
MEDAMGISTPPLKQLRIPTELLKTFQGEMRLVPNHLPVAGYITFDRQMLVSILRSQDPAAKEHLAAALEKLDAQWELVLVAPTEETVAAER